MASRPAPPAAGRRRQAGLLAGTCLAALTAAAACATVPTSGKVQQAQNNAGQAVSYPQAIPIAPHRGWKPTDVVEGFLQASASGFDNEQAVARQYLTSSLAARWHPSWAVTVVSSQLNLSLTKLPPRIVGGAPLAQVSFTDQRLAALTAHGQYQASSGSHGYQFQLRFDSKSGMWQISGLPSDSQLLLTKPDFLDVYRPHDLYFASPSGPVLVPDPVFLPQTAPQQQLADALVAGLRQPPSWLTGGAVTRFPGHATVRVSISDSVATVNVRGAAAARTSRATRAAMAAQLAYTLAVPSYSPRPIAQSVNLEINGVPQHLYNQPYQSAAAHKTRLRRWLPALPSRQLYFLHNGAVYVWTGGKGRPVPGPAGRGRYSLSGLAAAPRGGTLAGFGTAGTSRGRAGCMIYSGLAGRRARVVAHRLPGPCMSLSYDAGGELWAVAGGELWLLPPGASPVQVPIFGLTAAETITDLRVAPDGVRAAMIVRDQRGTPQVEIGAILRGAGGPSIGQTETVADNVSDPWQLVWYGSDDVLVLSHAGSALYEAPVDGGEASRISSEPGTTSITSNGTAMAVAADRSVQASSGPNGSWNLVGPGTQPALPGG